MTTRKHKAKLSPVESLLTEDPDLMKALLRQTLEEVLQAEMTEFLSAAASERTDSRSGDRAGDDSRNWVSCIGKLELCVPRDRNGEFSTALFERDQKEREGPGGGPGRDGRARPLHPQGQGHHRGVVRSPLLGQHDEQHQQGAGRSPGAVCQAAPGRGLSLPDARR